MAAFCPGSALDHPATITEVAPVKYQFITAGQPLQQRENPLPEEDRNNAGHEERGSNGAAGSELSLESFGGRGPEDKDTVQSLRFRLLNLRDKEGYRFGLFTGGMENPVLVAKTNQAVTFAREIEVGGVVTFFVNTLIFFYFTFNI